MSLIACQTELLTLWSGDVLESLARMPDGSVNCVVTSPPYWGLRDYGVAGQIGLEATPQEFVAKMVAVFQEVRRVLTKDGTCWINLGDSYNAYNGGAGPGSKLSKVQTENRPALATGFGLRCTSLKPKDLCGIPWRVAFALQDDGWYLRSDIIWSKPNPMPESVTDRPTKAHEYLFLLTKSAKYFYNADAIKEPVADATIGRLSQDVEAQAGSARANGGAKTNGAMKAVLGGKQKEASREVRGGASGRMGRGAGWRENTPDAPTRNKRSVWTIPTQSYKDAHFATFPEEIPRTCILAGCPEGGTVLDPFAGSGTSLAVAIQLGRKAVGIELNPDYCELIKKRVQAVTPGFQFEASA